jgi:hypothetical protein
LVFFLVFFSNDGASQLAKTGLGHPQGKKDTQTKRRCHSLFAVCMHPVRKRVFLRCHLCI